MIAPLLLLAAAPPTPAPPAPSAPLQEVALTDGPPGSSFHYDYVDGALVLGDLDGLRVGASVHVEGPWIAVGRLDWLGDDGGATDVDLQLLSLGGGYVHAVDERLDVLGTAELEIGRTDVDGPGQSADDDDVGVRLRAGARYQATDRLEVDGGISLSTIFDEDLGADARALYAFDERFSGFAGLDARDDTLVLLGVRYRF